MIQKNRTPSSSVTFAVVGNNTALVASLNDTKWMTNILHGEVYGILTASLMMLKSLLRPLTSSPSLYSDHLNSVTLLDGNRPHPYQLSSNPARSLYRWIFHTRDAALQTGLPTESQPEPSETPPSSHTYNMFTLIPLPHLCLPTLTALPTT
ncbi:hypothetical protein BDZ97DRAFT_840690 [Flammula alnicola]|nr:hypothetical protein BDZ97DRAFT_840690 [Flammula alnicola]